LSKTEHAWKIYEYLSSYIHFADAKAGAVIAIATLGIASLALLPASLAPWQAASIRLSLLLLLGSVVCALVTLVPRTNKKARQGSIFWGNIAAHDSYSDYQTTLQKSEDFEEVVKQIYYLAGIAETKYWWVSKGIWLQVAGLPLLFISTIAARFL
jgi:hypothetical protein